MDVQPSRHIAPEHDALARRLDRPIVLIGMMGVGKSSVGKRLSMLLGWQFVDADDEIEKSAQMTIPEIFATYGEDYFRDGERRVIARLVSGPDHRIVLATGGGAFSNPDTRALILDRAVIAGSTAISIHWWSAPAARTIVHCSRTATRVKFSPSCARSGRLTMRRRLSMC